MSDDLITVKRYFYDHKTLLIEPMLQAAGIDYFMKDQRTVTVDLFLSNALNVVQKKYMRKNLTK